VDTFTVLVLQNVWTAAKSNEKKLTEMIGFISSPQGKNFLLLCTYVTFFKLIIINSIISGQNIDPYVFKMGG